MTKPDTISSLRAQTTGMTAEHIQTLAMIDSVIHAAKAAGAVHVGVTVLADGTLTAEVAFYSHDDDAEEALG